MRTLVISDVHNRIIRAQSIIDKVPHDKLVLTGDYFDSYGEGADAAEYARNTAVWLKEKILHNPKAVALLGNHDTSYIFDNNIFGYASITNSVFLPLNPLPKIFEADIIVMREAEASLSLIPLKSLLAVLSLNPSTFKKSVTVIFKIFGTVSKPV